MSRFILSVRFQLLGALLLAVVFPAFVRGNFSVEGFTFGNQPQTMAGAALAIALGFFFYRRLTAFSGANPEAYLIPTFSAAYAVIVLAYFLFRFDYTRTTFLVSFLLTVMWFYFFSLIKRRIKPFRLAVVPGGDVDRLKQIPGVDWITLSQTQPADRSWDGVVADLRADLPDSWVRFIADSALASIPVFHIKQVYETLTGQVEIEHLSENMLGSLNPNQAYLEIKQTVDWFFALIVLLTLWPLLLVISIFIKLDSPGSALFIQNRTGHRGASIAVYKFRTMRSASVARRDVSDVSGASETSRDHAITKDDDDRITRVGKFLRRTRLDELPQIINILRGEMSWIGPRPEAVVLSEWYEAELPFYSYRHIVRPGITGWAQVNQGHVAGVDDVHEKLHYDFYYIKNFSMWLDIFIALKTVRTVLTGFGAR